MNQEVYILKCNQCMQDVYGFMTSAFEETMTILYECNCCGNVWTEDREIHTEPDKKEDGQSSQDQAV